MPSEGQNNWPLLCLLRYICSLSWATDFTSSCCNAESHKDTENAESTKDHKGKVTS